MNILKILESLKKYIFKFEKKKHTQAYLFCLRTTKAIKQWRSFYK